MISRGRTIATNFIKGVVNFVRQLPSKIGTYLSNALSRVTTWGSNLVAKGKKAASDLFSGIVEKISGLPSKLTSIGSDLVKGLWNGISNMAGWIKSKISGFGDGVLNSLKKFFGIASPSKLMRDEVGRYIAEGIGVGVTDNADKPLDALNELSADMAAQNINGATINRKLATTFSGGAAGAVTTQAALLNKLDGIYERLNRLQIVLDTGALVGETIDKIDAGLANKQLLSARGV